MNKRPALFLLKVDRFSQLQKALALTSVVKSRKISGQPWLRLLTLRGVLLGFGRKAHGVESKPFMIAHAIFFSLLRPTHS